MLKLWLAVGIAAVAALITIVMGITNQSRFMVTFFRAIFAGVFFGCIGYALAVFFERIGLPYLLAKEGSPEDGPLTDKVENEEEEIVEERLDGKQEEAEFSPLTADSLSRVSPPGS